MEWFFLLKSLYIVCLFLSIVGFAGNTFQDGWSANGRELPFGLQQLHVCLWSGIYLKHRILRYSLHHIAVKLYILLVKQYRYCSQPVGLDTRFGFYHFQSVSIKAHILPTLYGGNVIGTLLEMRRVQGLSCQKPLLAPFMGGLVFGVICLAILLLHLQSLCHFVHNSLRCKFFGYFVSFVHEVVSSQ